MLGARQGLEAGGLFVAPLLRINLELVPSNRAQGNFLPNPAQHRP